MIKILSDNDTNTESISKVAIPEMFQYHRPTFPEDCDYNLSPSQLGKFFDYPSEWCRENILNEEQSFQGNTASVTGTIVHHICKSIVLKESVLKIDINAQLLTYAQLKPELNLDVDKIISDYLAVAEAIINLYLIPFNEDNEQNLIKIEVKTEQQVITKVAPKIYMGGTYDRLEGDCIVDYKTVSIKPNTQRIPFSYKLQLLAYAYILEKLGHEVNKIRIVYGVKPTKTLPARVFVVTEDIDISLEALINSSISLITESIIEAEKNPAIMHLIFKDMSLKNILVPQVKQTESMSLQNMFKRV